MTTAGVGPAAAPATRPTTPTATVRSYLDAIDHDDRATALAFWDTPTPLDGRYAAAQVDMMLAIARLKHAVVAKWGRAAPDDLRMAMVNPDEFGDLSEAIAGEKATVTITSAVPMARTDEYPLIHARDGWRLSANGRAGDRPAHATTEAVYAGGRRLTDLIDRVGKDVRAGKCADTDDVLRRISEGLGAMGAQ